MKPTTRKRITLGLTIALLLVIIGLLARAYILQSAPYLQATRFLSASNAINEEIGQITNHQFLSFGFRTGDETRVYFRFFAQTRTASASITIWLEQLENGQGWRVTNHRTAIIEHKGSIAPE